MGRRLRLFTAGGILLVMDFPQKVIVAGQEVDLTHYTSKEKGFYYDLAEEIIERYETGSPLRSIVGFAGPSGAGKSTLVEILSKLILDTHGIVLGIDAYHYPNTFLREQNLLDRKGRQDTYDVGALVKDLRDFHEGNPVGFPAYSRKNHEPIAGGGGIYGRGQPGLLLFEGLWLLFDEGKWQEVRHFLDYAYYVDVDPKKGKTQTVLRHILGGRSSAEASVFYDSSDAKNTELVRETKHLSDEIIFLP